MIIFFIKIVIGSLKNEKININDLNMKIINLIHFNRRWNGIYVKIICKLNKFKNIYNYILVVLFFYIL
jgi:hypothetical protein